MTARKNDDKDWPDTTGKTSPSQPGPTYDNPNEDTAGTATHGDTPGPSTGNTEGGGSADTSGAPAGTTGTL